MTLRPGFAYEITSVHAPPWPTWTIVCHIDGYEDQVVYGPSPRHDDAMAWLERHQADTIPKRSTLRRRRCLACADWMDPTYALFCGECWPGGGRRGLPAVRHHDPTCSHPQDHHVYLGHNPDRPTFKETWSCSRCGFMWTSNEVPVG